MPKITDFSEDTTADDTDYFAIVQGGVTKRISVANASKYFRQGLPTRRPMMTPGNLYDQRGVDQISGTSASVTLGTNTMRMSKFTPAFDTTIDRLGIATNTGGAGALAKVVIYSSDTTTKFPQNVLFEGAQLDISPATTYVYQDLTSTPYTFTGGLTYWLGFRSNGTTASVRATGLHGPTFGYILVPSQSWTYSVVLRAVTWGNALPDPFTLVSGDLLSNTSPPSIRFRIATP